MFKIWKFALLLICFGVESAAFAQQPNPTVEIVLGQPTAQIGDTVTVEVYVRDAVNIAGTDVGITVDPTCLRITDRQVGQFLPTEAENRGFSAFSELHDHDTRLAASLLKDGPIANGNGMFFSVKLQVTCEKGIAPINIVFVELTEIADPANPNTTFVVYKLDKGNVSTINAQLAIGPVGSVTAIVPSTPEGQATTVGANTPDGQTATVMPNATPGETVAGAPQSPIALVAVLGLTIAGAILLIVIFWFVRRRSKDEEQE